MKKAIDIFLLCVFGLAGLAFWALAGHIAWNGRTMVMAVTAVIVGAFAIYF